MLNMDGMDIVRWIDIGGQTVYMYSSIKDTFSYPVFYHILTRNNSILPWLSFISLYTSYSVKLNSTASPNMLFSCYMFCFMLSASRVHFAIGTLWWQVLAVLFFRPNFVWPFHQIIILLGTFSWHLCTLSKNRNVELVLSNTLFEEENSIDEENYEID